MLAGRSDLRGRTLLGVGLLVAVTSAGLTWWLGTNVRSPAQAAAEARPPPASPITAPVEKRKLTATLITRGTVRAARRIDVGFEGSVPGARTVVTKQPLAVGAEVTEGTVLVEVAGRPVFALQGAIPSYRELHLGVNGEDVAQLQAALARLGFRAWDRRGVFGRSTERAVRRFYKARGYAPQVRPDGGPSGGSDAQLDSKPAMPLPVPTTSSPSSTRPQQVPQSPAPPDSPPTTERRSKPQKALVVPFSELVFVDRFPAWVIQRNAQVGQPAKEGLLELATGKLDVTLKLTAQDKNQVRLGDRATVEVEARGVRFAAKVASIASTPSRGEQQPEGSQAQTGQEPTSDRPAASGGYPAVVSSRRPIDPALIGQDVKVTITTASSRRNVLVVPVSAIWARADGSSYVVRRSADGREEDLPVRPGLSAAGFVELRQAKGKLRPGDLLVVGEGRPR